MFSCTKTWLNICLVVQYLTCIHCPVDFLYCFFISCTNIVSLMIYTVNLYQEILNPILLKYTTSRDSLTNGKLFCNSSFHAVYCGFSLSCYIELFYGMVSMLYVWLFVTHFFGRTTKSDFLSLRDLTLKYI